jgi:hypothetical protein
MWHFTRVFILSAALAFTAATSATAQSEAEENASCMGLGASFYGQFAPQQMGFVAQFVIDQADITGEVPGETFSEFAGEKEGGSIPSPCGTRLE